MWNGARQETTLLEWIRISKICVYDVYMHVHVHMYKNTYVCICMVVYPHIHMPVYVNMHMIYVGSMYV